MHIYVLLIYLVIFSCEWVGMIHAEGGYAGALRSLQCMKVGDEKKIRSTAW